MPKLKVGDQIQVFGWVMLHKLEEGEYQVMEIKSTPVGPAYVFRRKRAKKRGPTHYVAKVEAWLRDSAEDPDLNKIVIIQKGQQ